MPRKCTQTDLLNIAKGACFLASGGGGTYASGEHLANHFVQCDYYTDPSFEMVGLDEISDNDNGYGVVVAYLGAPEAIKSVNYPKGAVHAIERLREILRNRGQHLKYVVPAEVGALSSVVPCLVASKLGLKVVDGDGAGRAVPEMTMLSFPSTGVSCDPTVLANSEGFCIELSIHEGGNGDDALKGAATVEKIARPTLAIPQFEEIAGLAVWVMNAKQLGSAIKSTGTLQLARKTGEKIATDALPQVLQFLRDQGKSVFHLFHGQFDKQQCSSVTAGGFDHGAIAITHGIEQFRIIYQNESLLAWSDQSSQPRAIAPDSIALLVEDEQKAYSIGDIMNADGTLSVEMDGKPVSVIGIAAEPFLREGQDNRILSVFTDAIRRLGYYGDNHPIAKLEEKK